MQRRFNVPPLDHPPDPNPPNFPKRLPKRSISARHKVHAPRPTARPPKHLRAARPPTAQVDIECQRQIVEVARDIARRAGEIGRRRAPGGGVGAGGGWVTRRRDDVGGCGVAGEEPLADAEGVEGEGEDAAAVLVEGLAECCGGPEDAASGVFGCGVDAGGGEHEAGLAALDVLHGAPVGGVERRVGA